VVERPCGAIALIVQRSARSSRCDYLLEKDAQVTIDTAKASSVGMP
jgi:hypothetical protein